MTRSITTAKDALAAAYTGDLDSQIGFDFAMFDNLPRFHHYGVVT